MQVLGFLEKAQLENTATDLTDNVAGLVWLNTASSRVKFYDGAITRTVVDENSTQVLTGKTLSGNTMANFSPDGVENITAPAVSGAMLVDQHELNNMNFLHQATPATPAAGGIKVYSKNDDQLYKLDSEGNEIQIGTGGGGLDVFHIEDFETNNAADFSTGNNVLYLGGGVLAGTLADETIDPISKTRSIKYTQAAGSLNDYFTSPAFDIDPKQAGNYCGFTAYFTYDGDAGDIKFVLYDATNGAVISSVLDVVSSADNPTRFRLQAFIPAGVTSLRWGAQVVVENVGAILVCDDVEITSDPVRNVEIYASSDAVDYEPAYTGIGTTTNNNVTWWRSGHRLYMSGSFQSGTVTDSPLGIPLPSNYKIDQTKITNDRTVAGYGYRNHGANSYVITRYQLVLFPSATDDNIIYFGGESSSGIAINKTNADDFISPSVDTVMFEFSVPIEGWSDTTDATVETSDAKSESTTVYGTTVYGTTSTKVPVFDTIQTNTANELYTFENTAEFGAVVTVLKEASFTFNFSAGFNGSYPLGITLNSTTQTGNIDGMDKEYILDLSYSVSVGKETPTTWTGILPAGSIVRPQTNGWAIFDVTRFSVTATPTSVNLNIIRPAVQVAYIKDVKANVNGGTSVATTWSTRDLNTVEGDSSVVSISSNQFTLTSGSYDIFASSPYFDGSRITTKIVNITDATDSIFSSTMRGAANEQFNSLIMGNITITDTKVFELQYYVTTGQATDGLGAANVGAGATQVYTQIRVTKLR